MTERKPTGRERNRLYLERKRRGWSANTVANQVHNLGIEYGVPADQLGVDGRTVYRWESGATQPNPLYVALLSILYTQPPEELDLPPLVIPLPSRAHPYESGAASPAPALPTVPAVPPTTTTEDPFLVIRRQFLKDMLATAATVLLLPDPEQAILPWPSTRLDMEALLSECRANFTVCWRLLLGSDLIVIPSVLIRWLPLLERLVREDTRYSKALASLASEGYVLAGIVAVLHGHNDRGEWCCKQAVQYAAMTDVPNLYVAALKHLATKYNDARYPLLTLSTYQQAVPFLDRTTPLLRSRINLGLALAYAQCGHQREAMQRWNIAQELFPDDPQSDPAFDYADCRRSSLNHYGGLIYRAFGEPLEAWRTFNAATTGPIVLDVPERTVVEIIICKADAAVAAGDVELACNELESAYAGAFRLRSEQRFNASLEVFNRLQRTHPGDHRVQRLEPLFEPADFHRPLHE
jgi:DNA-binding transcriptional regulator YiaG